MVDGKLICTFNSWSMPSYFAALKGVICWYDSSRQTWQLNNAMFLPRELNAGTAKVKWRGTDSCETCTGKFSLNSQIINMYWKQWYKVSQQRAVVCHVICLLELLTLDKTVIWQDSWCLIMNMKDTVTVAPSLINALLGLDVLRRKTM